MKKIIFLLLISYSALAQNVDYNKIILPDNTHTTEFGEKLVQLAWRNHPDNEIVRRDVKVASYEVKKNSASWLDIIHLQGNVNEFTINPNSEGAITGRANMFPKYNFGAEIRLGMLFSIPYNTKQSRELHAIAMSSVNSKKLEVRNAVLRAYNEYLMRERIFKIQTQLLADNETSHKLVEGKFKSGEVTFENYSISLGNYSKINIELLQAEKEYKNAKLDLEQLIGLRLEDVR